MVQLSIGQLVAFAASLPLVVAHPADLSTQRGPGDFSCGTITKPKDLAAIQQVVAAGTFKGFEGLRARDRLVARDVKYPWGNITINTWIHVISNGTRVTDGNVPQTQLDAQLAYLNKHFAPSNFQFRLEGVTRTVNSVWAFDPPGAQLGYKKALRKGDYATLNLYFLPKLDNDALGYGFFPIDAVPESDDFYLSGVSNNAFTVPGGSSTGYNLGGTAVHEVGHWMALMHTFGSPIGETAAGAPIWDCVESTDMIADTPAQLGPSAGCPTSRDSCPQTGLDPIHNWMDYSSDLCYEEFTPLQVKQMWDSWFFYRQPRTCEADTCLSAMGSESINGRLEESQAFCSSITQTIITEVSAFKDYAVDACSGNVASRVSSACSCLPAAPTGTA